VLLYLALGITMKREGKKMLGMWFSPEISDSQAQVPIRKEKYSMLRVAKVDECSWLSASCSSYLFHVLTCNSYGFSIKPGVALHTDLAAQ
jgi:hypothetical protein